MIARIEGEYVIYIDRSSDGMAAVTIRPNGESLGPVVAGYETLAKGATARARAYVRSL